MPRRPRLIPALFAALMLATCAGTDHCADSSVPPGPDAEVDGQVSPLDGRPETAPDAETIDAPGPAPDAAPDSGPGSCSFKTADGLHLNPGCDPDVQAKGITAADLVTIGGKTYWLVVAGKKWWKLDLAQGRFIEGGKEVATFFKNLKPGCSLKTSAGVHFNPGCDPGVQASGVTALGSQSGSATTDWILNNGLNWWIYSGTLGAFTLAGKDYAGALWLIKPDCTAKTSDGLHLNPGCDPDVKAKGLSTIDVVTRSGKTLWVVTRGGKWWAYDKTARSGAGAFTEGGKSFAADLKSLQPDCSAKTPDGINLNPGCDPDVQASGVTAASAMTVSGTSTWFLSSGTKWWSYDQTKGAFTGGGKDSAFFFRWFKP